MLHFNFPLFNIGYTLKFQLLLDKTKTYSQIFCFCLVAGAQSVKLAEYICCFLVIPDNYHISLPPASLHPCGQFTELVWHFLQHPFHRHPNSLFCLECETPNFSFTSLYYTPQSPPKKGRRREHGCRIENLIDRIMSRGRRQISENLLQHNFTHHKFHA